ncbi:uncharacterized protein VTP21DRAFT_4634 [Calcarisporiella thermophila]|uniref:uncharacterized protein n=1 Tax=Calcarisporiella thermophila TaxID=911321 RepID=UPI003744A692
MMQGTKDYVEINTDQISTENPTKSSPPPAKGLKKLIQTYGPIALAMYVLLSVGDLSLIFLLLHFGGSGAVKGVEDFCRENLGKWVSRYFEQKDALSTDEAEGPSLWTMFLVAYAVHKILMPLRLLIVAAVTPKIGPKLEEWGLWKSYRQIKKGD